jgi:ABC-2 type transport system permease protein
MRPSIFFQALRAELLKNKRSRIVWITFLAFGIAPMMGGLFMLILQHPEIMPKAGMMKNKATAMAMTAEWNSLLLLLSQAMGVGGVLIFGFVASWLFGREYSDGTAKDLLALPVPRSAIVSAKFLVYGVWCAALTLSNLLIGLGIGIVLGLPNWNFEATYQQMGVYAVTALLTMLADMPIALFALWGKGYLAPLGFVVMTLVFSQIIAALGYGTYFPWAIPGLFSGAAGEMKAGLSAVSYSIVAATGLVGYVVSVWYWNVSDHVQ